VSVTGFNEVTNEHFNDYFLGLSEATTGLPPQKTPSETVVAAFLQAKCPF